MANRFELTKNTSGQFHFSLRAPNSEKILSGETYTSKGGALNGVESVRTNSPVDTNFHRKTATNGQPYFVLVAANHEPIGTSETYSSVSAMEHGIASVKLNAPTASIDDKT
jgi:uncharacterized protein YegP (UPF0339 family)